MSDLVGNPEDRFSHNEAHIKVGCEGVTFTQVFYHDVKRLHENTCLPGLHSDQTQNKLCKHKRWLEGIKMSVIDNKNYINLRGSMDKLLAL